MWILIAVALACAVAGPRPACAGGADSTIAVIGFATQIVPADRAVLGVDIRATGKPSRKLRRRLESRLAEVRDIIDSIGAGTVESSTNTIQEIVQHDGNRQRVTGLITHIRVTCMDRRRYTELYLALKSDDDITLRISEYMVSDDREYNDLLLGLAAKDARRQAEAIASGLGVKVGNAVEVVISPPMREVQDYYSERRHTLAYLAMRPSGYFKPPNEELPNVYLRAAVKVRFAIR